MSKKIRIYFCMCIGMAMLWLLFSGIPVKAAEPEKLSGKLTKARFIEIQEDGKKKIISLVENGIVTEERVEGITIDVENNKIILEDCWVERGTLELDHAIIEMKGVNKLDKIKYYKTTKSDVIIQGNGELNVVSGLDLKRIVLVSGTVNSKGTVKSIITKVLNARLAINIKQSDKKEEVWGLCSNRIIFQNADIYIRVEGDSYCLANVQRLKIRNSNCTLYTPDVTDNTLINEDYFSGYKYLEIGYYDESGKFIYSKAPNRYIDLDKKSYYYKGIGKAQYGVGYDRICSMGRLFYEGDGIYFSLFGNMNPRNYIRISTKELPVSRKYTVNIVGYKDLTSGRNNKDYEIDYFRENWHDETNISCSVNGKILSYMAYYDKGMEGAMKLRSDDYLDPGTQVKVKVSDQYKILGLEVNGKWIASDTFTMPERDVEIQVYMEDKEIGALEDFEAYATSTDYQHIKIIWKEMKEAKYYIIYKKGEYVRSVDAGEKNSVVLKVMPCSTNTYTVEVRYDENMNIYYKKEVTLTVKSQPNKGTITKAVSKEKGKATVTWKRISGVHGYELFKSSTKNGKYTKAATITPGTNLSYTLKGYSRKQYFYKIRGYRNVNGKRVYGPYSSPKVVKMK